MTFNYLSGLLFVFGLYSCADEPPKAPKHEKYFGSYSKKYSRISIENGPRQGFQYVDSTGTEYSYRYITTTITNDSVVPVHLNISFSKEYNYLRLKDSLKSRVFLLPRELTPERQHFDNSMSKALRKFLDTGVNVPVSLDKIINPNERCVMTFAVLTDMKYSDFFNITLLSSDHPFHSHVHDSLVKLIAPAENPLTLSLGLMLDRHFIIPCGQISFESNKLKTK